MNELQILREEMLSVTMKLFDVFLERQRLAEKIGDVKYNLNIPLRDEKTEEKIFKEICG